MLVWLAVRGVLGESLVLSGPGDLVEYGDSGVNWSGVLQKCWNMQKQF